MFWPFTVQKIVLVISIFCKFSAFSLEFQKLFSITRTIFLKMRTWVEGVLYFHFFFQVFGIFCTMAAEQLLSHTGNDLLANGMLAGVLLLGTILTAFIKADYRRQAASKPQGNLLMGIDNCWAPTQSLV